MNNPEGWKLSERLRQEASAIDATDVWPDTVALLRGAAAALDTADKFGTDAHTAAAQWMARAKGFEELLQSAGAIALREGAGTAWARFTASLKAAGINGVTARTYRVLPSDAATPTPPEQPAAQTLKCHWPGCPHGADCVHAKPAAQEVLTDERLLAIAGEAWDRHQSECRITTVEGSLGKVVAAIKREVLADIDRLRARCEAADALLRRARLRAEPEFEPEFLAEIDAHLNQGAGRE